MRRLHLASTIEVMKVTTMAIDNERVLKAIMATVMSNNQLAIGASIIEAMTATETAVRMKVRSIEYLSFGYGHPWRSWVGG